MSVGVFIGAALSAGTILGSLTWYVASKSVLEKMVQPFTAALNYTGLVLGTEGQSEKKCVVGHDEGDLEEPSLLVTLRRRVEQLERRLKRLEEQKD